MEEKERYEIVYFDNDTSWKIIDNKTKKEVGGIDDMIKLLNQQDKENQQLKQAQNKKAIKELEEIRKTIRYAKEICGGTATDLDIITANAYNRCLDDMQKIIDSQIKELKG